MALCDLHRSGKVAWFAGRIAVPSSSSHGRVAPPDRVQGSDQARMSIEVTNAAMPTAAPRRAPRTGPWRVGLLGAGYIADWHAKAIRAAEGVSLVAICDRVKSRADVLAAVYHIPHVFDSLADMLGSKTIDAVHVLLPPEHHYQAASEILAAGVHAFLEKPMCLEARECKALVSFARQKNCRLGVSHNFLFAQSYQKLRDDIRHGLLGRLG